MSDLHVTLNGLPVENATIYEPHRGPWFAVVKLVKDLAPTGKATLKVGAASWVGTVDPTGTGDFGGRGSIRVIAGANGWGKHLPSRDYNSDAGIRSSQVATDVATEAGESITTFNPQRVRIGTHFARVAGPAGQALDAVIGNVGWWVDRAGKTLVGVRPAAPLAPSAIVGIQEYDPVDNGLKFSSDNLTLVQVGQTITSPLIPHPLTISDLEIRVTPESISLKAHCDNAKINEVADLLSAIARRATGDKLFGVYEYRVIDMVADRARLQSTDPSIGLPNLDYIEQWPSLGGAHTTPSPSSIVLVQFINGSPQRPVIVGFRDGRQEAPVQVEIGKNAPAAAARQGDTVEVLLPPAVFSGTIGGVPATGVLTFPLAKTLGSITSGSPLVRIGT